MTHHRPLILICSVLTGAVLLSAPLKAQESSAEEPVSPAGAFVRSLVLPGWGQMAAGSPHRGAVYFALEAGSLWMAVKTRQRLRDVRALEQSIRTDPAFADPEVDDPWWEARLDAVASLRRERENQFEDWMTLAVFTALLSAADALVAAYLQDFDEHLQVGLSEHAEVRVGITLPLGRR